MIRRYIKLSVIYVRHRVCYVILILKVEIKNIYISKHIDCTDIMKQIVYHQDNGITRLSSVPVN